MSIKEATKELSVNIQDAAFPKPFYQGLEFNAPVHGNWNIVHIGMLLPEARQIYVCADNCMRGVVLTAAEMKAEDRFSFVLLEENDLIMGKLEDVTIDGVSECLESLDEKPPVVLLFTVCVHHFLGCDLDYVYRKLHERYPDIYFCRCYMDPLLQKSGPTPDQKLRAAMYDPIKPLAPETSTHTVSLIGSEFPLHKSCDIYRIIDSSACRHDIRLRELGTCQSYKDFLKIGESSLLIAEHPGAVMALERLSERLSCPSLYLPKSFSYEEIADEWLRLSASLCDILSEERNNARPLMPCEEIPDSSDALLGEGNPDNKSGLSHRSLPYENIPDDIYALLCESIKAEQAACEEAFAELKELIGDTEIRIDYTFHPRPLGLAHQLIAHGFKDTTVYIDVINAEEEADFNFLREHAPRLKLCSTVQVEARTALRDCPNVLAVGQKAAWFSGTKHFVNAVAGAGLFGYDGIRRTLALMASAYNTENDTEDLVIRKGWGCASCV